MHAHRVQVLKEDIIFVQIPGYRTDDGNFLAADRLDFGDLFSQPFLCRIDLVRVDRLALYFRFQTFKKVPLILKADLLE